MNQKEIEEIKKMDPKDILALAEEDKPEFRYGRREIFKAAAEVFVSKKMMDDAKKAQYEVFIQDLSTHEYPKKRFASMMTGTKDDGSEFAYPNLDEQINDVVVDYSKSRSKKTKSPILLARYSDVVWEFASKKEVGFAKLAIKSYLDACDIHFDNGFDHELSDDLDRALDLALKIKDKDLVKEVLDKNFEILLKFENAERYRYTLELVESIVRQNKRIMESIDWKILEKILVKSSGFFLSENNFHLQRSFLEKLNKVYALQKRAEDAKALRIKIAESYVAEAEYKLVAYPSGNMVAASFYENAIKVYYDIGGFLEKIKELELKIAKCNKEARSKEFTKVEFSFKVPSEAIDKHKNIYGTYLKKSVKEFFYFMSIDKNLIPSYEKSVNLAKENMKKYIFSHIGTGAIMKGNVTIKKLFTDEDKLKADAIHNYMLNCELISTTLLNQIFELFRKKNSKSLLNEMLGLFRKKRSKCADDLVEFIGLSEIISDERKKMVKVAIERYFSGDYLSSMHILVAQLEGTLRDMVQALGYPTVYVKPQTGEGREHLLGTLLRVLGEINGVDARFLKFLEILLCNILGYNFRNEIAHGLLPLKDFNRENCTLLILALIKLSVYKVQVEKPSR